MDDLPNDTNDIEKYVAYEKHLFIFIDGQSPSVTQSGEWMTVELSNTNQPTSGKRTSMGQLILGTQKNHWSSLGPLVEGACKVEIDTNDFRLKLKAGSTLEAPHHCGPLGVPVRKQLLELACQLQMWFNDLYSQSKNYENLRIRYLLTAMTVAVSISGSGSDWYTFCMPWKELRNLGTLEPGTLVPWYLLCCWVSKLGKWLGIGETRKIPSLIDIVIMQLHVYNAGQLVPFPPMIEIHTPGLIPTSAPPSSNGLPAENSTSPITCMVQRTNQTEVQLLQWKNWRKRLASIEYVLRFSANVPYGSRIYSVALGAME